jgi:hypothetical protein
MTGVANALRLEKITDVHFKRWQVEATLWLQAKYSELVSA